MRGPQCYLRPMTRLFTYLAAALLGTAALADPPKIEQVEASRAGMGWRFDVTVSHPDTGWDHYADGWELIDAAGNQIAYRELMHPHVEEQPFTRSLRNIMLPDGIKTVWVRARCSEGSWTMEPYEVTLSY